jgi:hypothetical protein
MDFSKVAKVFSNSDLNKVSEKSHSRAVSKLKKEDV